ncbi:hypothetical protein FOMPIDRAFT_1023968 [Fomitopsis schrenkii]|uniref:Uncharacterized protein n=1 Tax=Fomitopsis schrenkii TaxID=2126942 RepID=S8EAC1_FOMSC|nr:hypothetical protein FOMPIDRAFT_1023968 [Fomitopsis schrenkii]
MFDYGLPPILRTPRIRGSDATVKLRQERVRQFTERPIRVRLFGCVEELPHVGC